MNGALGTALCPLFLALEKISFYSFLGPLWHLMVLEMDEGHRLMWVMRKEVWKIQLIPDKCFLTLGTRSRTNHFSFSLYSWG